MKLKTDCLNGCSGHHYAPTKHLCSWTIAPCSCHRPTSRVKPHHLRRVEIMEKKTGCRSLNPLRQPGYPDFSLPDSSSATRLSIVQGWTRGFAPPPSDGFAFSE